MALDCLIFEKIAFFAFWRQTDEQMDSTDALSRSGYRERRLNNSTVTKRLLLLPLLRRRLCDQVCLSVMCLSNSVCVQDYCRCKQLILLKLGVMIGFTSGLSRINCLRGTREREAHLSQRNRAALRIVLEFS